MKRTLVIMALVLAGCGQGSEREANDLQEEKNNISPDQVISTEEQQKKDSTTRDIVGKDTTSHEGH